MNKATVERNKETGEFSCVVGGKTLLKGKLASKIKRVYDMVDAINMGALPVISSEGRGDKRRFTVTLGDFVFVAGMSAHAGYRELDELGAALTPVVEMPAVPVPDSAPVYETDDGKGNSFEGEQP